MNMVTGRILISSAAAALTLAGVLASHEALAADTGATYDITVTGLWTADRFPLEYPEAGLLTGPHLSGVIGASHNDKYILFEEGSKPTPGLERLSEEGKHSPLDSEIKAAIAAGTAGALFETDPIREFSKSVTGSVRVDAAHPMVSAVAMIAPSPDWFAGVANVNLMEGGEFVAEKLVDLYAWDSGGDDGTTYEADDKDNNPKKATAAASPRHFTVNGERMPVARITFKRK
jgi:hypothetical protein